MVVLKDACSLTFLLWIGGVYVPSYQPEEDLVTLVNTAWQEWCCVTSEFGWEMAMPLLLDFLGETSVWSWSHHIGSLTIRRLPPWNGSLHGVTTYGERISSSPQRLCLSSPGTASEAVLEVTEVLITVWLQLHKRPWAKLSVWALSKPICIIEMSNRYYFKSGFGGSVMQH